MQTNVRASSKKSGGGFHLSQDKVFRFFMYPDRNHRISDLECYRKLIQFRTGGCGGRQYLLALGIFSGKL